MLPVHDTGQTDYVDIGKTFISSRVSYARERGRLKKKAEPKRIPFILLGAGHIDVVAYLIGDSQREVYNYITSLDSTMIERIITRY